MKNHLFIGLGGQGGKTIAELQKVICSRSQDADHIKGLGQNWDFLYIDSSRDVTEERRNWVHFGKNLSLKPSSFLYLKDGGESIDARSLSLQPDVAPWIGDVEKLQGFLEGSQGIQGANQRRRLGRLLYARNSERIKKAVCEDKIGPMLSQGNECAIHVFASLAGGTGSGCVVDLVSMIRSEFPNASATGGFPIFLYLFVTNRKFEEAQVGFFHENQAAAIRDLNALAAGKFKPTLFGTGRNGAVFSGSEPASQILLSSHLTSRNQQLSLSQQHQIIAEAAFERIYSYASGNLDTTLQKSLTGEDLLATFSGEPVRNQLRSFRFGSVGMRRWEIPIDEVRELLARALQVSCLHQLLYQNWSESMGAAEAKLQTAIPGFSETENQIMALIARESAAKAYVDALADSLNGDLARFHAGKTKQGFKDLDLAGYEAELRERYDHHLDGRGVEEVFRAIVAERHQRVERIKSGIHDIIRQAWTRSTNRLGLTYISDILLRVQEHVRKNAEALNAEQARASQVRGRMDLRLGEWAKLTVLSRPLKQQKIALAHRDDTATLLREDLRAKTGKEDVEILDSVKQMLGTMITDFQMAVAYLSKMADEARHRRDELSDALHALKDGRAAATETVVANKPELSLENLQAYLKDQSLERALIDNASDEVAVHVLQPHLGTEHLTKLARLSEPMKVQIREELDAVLFRKAETIHQQIKDRTHRDSILTANVLDILQKRHTENPDAFQVELRKFIESASCNVDIAGSELQPRSLKGDPGMPNMPRTALVIGLPSRHPFGTELAAMVKNQLTAGSTERQGVYFHDDSTQIRMLSVKYWMGARFANVVHRLEDIYRASLANDPHGDFKYFTNLDVAGEKGMRPSVLLPSPAESACDMRSSTWIATRVEVAEGIPLIKDTGVGAVLMEQDNEGMLVPHKVGESIADLQKAADIVTICRVVDAVSAQVSGMGEESLNALKTALREDDTAKTRALGPGSKEHMEWVADRKRINELLNK